MVTKAISLANSSLLLIGADRITSFEDQTIEAVTVNEFYERSYRELLAMYPWKFALKTRSLGRLDEDVDYEYTYQYQLPTDFIWVQRTFPNQNYKILGTRLYCNSNEIGLKYIWRAPEENMPIYFEQTFMYYLASQICITLTENVHKQISLYDQFVDHLKKAKSLDSQQQPGDGFEDFSLINARW